MLILQVFIRTEFLKNRENYEIIDPVEVGIRESSIILTARSGRAALNHRLELLGFNFGKEEIDDIYHRFLLLADKKKEINDEDIRILAGVVFQGEKSLKLDLLQVSCGKSLIPVATVGVKINGEVHLCNSFRQRTYRCCIHCCQTTDKQNSASRRIPDSGNYQRKR